MNHLNHYPVAATRPSASLMTRTLFLALLALLNVCGMTALGEAATQDTATGVEFPHPDRIRYDSRSLFIDGKPVFILSGAMHYFRCPRELWKDRLQKMKGAGLNCVETYLAWRLHEPDAPANPNDFSKLRDMDLIGDFIQTAQDVGLYVIIRPGPYICAEVDRGGLPGWLMKYRPENVNYFLRGNSPDMLAWDRHWLAAAAKVVKPHLITNLPKGSRGVILWQLENEYDWSVPKLPSDVRTDVLRALAHASLDNGIDVPLFTCETTDPAFRNDPFLRSHIFNAANSYPNFNTRPLIDAIEKVAKYQPEIFRAVTELQGGWYAAVGGPLSDQKGHNAAQISQITLTAIERGCTLLNYYMFYGGANFGMVGNGPLTQSYDYNAPLREWGEEGDRYFAVKAIGRMLQEHGDRIVHSDPVELTIEGDHPDVSFYLRRSADGSQYFFVRNGKRDARSGTVKISTKDSAAQTLSYDLGDFEAKVFYVPAGAADLSQGKWLPDAAERPVPYETLPPAEPVRVTAIAREEPADKWKPLQTGKYLDSVDVFDQRYVHYRAKFDLSTDDLKSPMALLVRSEGSKGSMTARVNGTETQSSWDGFISLAGLARAGSNTVEILFENLGCFNARRNVEDQQGITHVGLVPQSTRKISLASWRMKDVEKGSPNPPEAGANFDDQNWPVVSLTEPKAIPSANSRVAYRISLPVSKDQIRDGVVLSFESVADQGALFVNGKAAGQADYEARPWTFDITQYLHEGTNSIAMLVQTDFDQRKGGLGRCTIEPVGRPVNDLAVSADTQIGKPLDAVTSRRMLVHYTMEFQIPRTAATASVPWKLRLEADLNAFMTLNGHPLGRYWAAGRQRDIWLPECWIHFGPDAKNVIELQSRPTSNAPVQELIRRAEVAPSTIANRETNYTARQ